MPSASFEKDFKYLWPFFDRLRDHASTLPQPSSAALLAQVLAARAACEQISDQLATAPEVGTATTPGPASPSATPSPATPSPATASAATKALAAAAPVIEARWTVGPLNPRQRAETPDGGS